MFGRIQMTTAGGSYDLAASLVSQSLGSLGAAISFPGGATFAPATGLTGRAANLDLYRLDNTTVTPGIYTYNGESFFSILTSSDVSTVRETIGASDSIEIDVTSFLPAGISIGDVGRMDYSFVQFTKPSDLSIEYGLSPVQIAAARAAAGLIRMPTLNGLEMAAVYNQPFVIGEGSNTTRYFGKAMSAVGAGLTGAVAGAAALGTAGLAVGAAGGTVAVPGFGTIAGAGALGSAGLVAGGIGGGLGGMLSSIGDSMQKNSEDDDTPDPELPDTIVPPSGPTMTVPELSSTHGVFAFAAVSTVWLVRRRRAINR